MTVVRPQRARRALIVLAVAAASVPLLALLPLCPFALVLRIPCPGCGMTRAALALLRGDWQAAVRFHPLAPVVVPVAVVILGAHGIRFVADGTWPSHHWGQALVMRFVWVYLVAMLAVWIARWFGYFGGPVPV